MIAVGEPAPDFSLKGPGGQPVTLAEYRGHRHVVIAFYPLAFSPVCSHQLPELERARTRIEALGGTLLGVSVDSWYANEAFAKRLGVGFPLLSDWDHAASEAWGVYLPARRYSNRALFVVDRDGRLAYAAVAPHPGEVPEETAVIEVLERLQAPQPGA
jgi:peroxiredoxin